jgi:hypothetical protein
MTTWEYKTVILTHGRLGHRKGEINRPDLEAGLAQAGQEGWSSFTSGRTRASTERRTEICCCSSGRPQRLAHRLARRSRKRHR